MSGGSFIVSGKRGGRVAARVFHEDGSEVFLTLTCTKCGTRRPLRFFGLRRMRDGTLRDIPQCKQCRGHSLPRCVRDTCRRHLGHEGPHRASGEPAPSGTGGTP